MLKPGCIDLSHWNVVIGDSYSAALASLQRMKAAGIHALIHKATESTGYKDPKLQARADLCRDAGISFGTYHFLRSANVGQQVAHYFDTVQSVMKHPGESEQWVWCCDYEDPGVGLSAVADFMDELDAVTGQVQQPVLYTGFALKDKIAAGQSAERLRKYRLWLAHYSSVPILPKGWDEYWLWQYTDKGSVPGIVAPTDCNAYDGTVEELTADWLGTTVKPPDFRAEPPELGQPEPGQTYTTTITITSSAPIKVTAA